MNKETVKVEEIKTPNTKVIVREESFMTQQKADLKYVRETMKEIMKTLSDNSTTTAYKKQFLPVFIQLNNSAKILVSACITEIAIDKITPREIVTIEAKEKEESAASN